MKTQLNTTDSRVMEAISDIRSNVVRAKAVTSFLESTHSRRENR